MSDFEHELLDMLEKNGKFDSAREEVLRLQVTSEFARKKKRLLIWTWVWHAACLLILLPGLYLISDPWNYRAGFQGLTMVVLGAALLATIKLWYWVVHGRLEIMREIKRLELRWTLQNRESQPKQGNAG